jgi:hypothetical protein
VVEQGAELSEVEPPEEEPSVLPSPREEVVEERVTFTEVHIRVEQSTHAESSPEEGSFAAGLDEPAGEMEWSDAGSDEEVDENDAEAIERVDRAEGAGEAGGRRRRRRRRGRRGETERETRAVASAQPEEPAEEDDDEEELVAEEGMLAEEEEDLGEEETIDLSNWNVPSWAELIAGLYRPER